ncbi:hypothetical protein AGLY_009139 [Aphis glycines]|uniref:Uncharacterized protein n=1 Tax=Aphis glycines TaxID=307491 RepID=A0A6G0TJ20_APHGL|nr:hypothetical protein AGLY_009139 [Aphis glycines]
MMIGCAPDGDEMFLMPLKKRKHLVCPGDGQSLRERRCGDTGPDKCGAPRPRRRSVCATEDDDLTLKPVTCPGPCFEDSAEWQSTKSTAACLFRALGQHYDEPWFPTVINEWSALYYQCSHACDYWQGRDEWLAGDEEVRLTVWSEVLDYREQHKRQLNDGCNSEVRTTVRCISVGPIAWMSMRGGQVTETHGCPNKANDRFDLPHKNVEQLCEEDLPSTDDSARAEAEVAEIALADPDDNPDWVEMRRKMRGSFAALNVARCEVNAELLDHIMIELCKYWANVPETEYPYLIDQQLEENIIQEIQNFRFKLFDVAIIIEPEIQQLGPETYQDPKPSRKQESCQKPEPCQKPKSCSPSQSEPCCPRKPESCRLREPAQCFPREPKSCLKPEPYSPSEPEQCCPSEPKSCQKPESCCPKDLQLCCPRGPESYCSQNPEPCCPLSPPKPKCCTRRRSTKTKLAEARARHNATQVRDRDITTGWLGGNPHE